FACLDQGQDLEQFIERSIATRKNDQGAGAQKEMHFAQRKITEMKSEFGRDVRIRLLFVREGDVQADGPGSDLEGAAIGRLHDARPAARDYRAFEAGVVLEKLRHQMRE